MFFFRGQQTGEKRDQVTWEDNLNIIKYAWSAEHNCTIANFPSTSKKKVSRLKFFRKKDQFLWHTIGFNLEIPSTCWGWFFGSFFKRLIVFTITPEGWKLKNEREIWNFLCRSEKMRRKISIRVMLMGFKFSCHLFDKFLKRGVFRDTEAKLALKWTTTGIKKMVIWRII